jgi:hypothetical protein
MMLLQQLLFPDVVAAAVVLAPAVDAGFDFVVSAVPSSAVVASAVVASALLLQLLLLELLLLELLLLELLLL